MRGFPAATIHVIIGKARDNGIPGILAWVISAIIAIGMAVSSIRTLGFPQLPVVVIAFFLYVGLFQIVLRLGFTIAYGLTSFAYRYYLNHRYDRRDTSDTYTGFTDYSKTGNYESDTSGKGYQEDSNTYGYGSSGYSSGQSYWESESESTSYVEPDVEWAKAMFGISGTYTEEELKKIRNRKIKENHPDEGGDEEKCKDFNRAYDILREYLQNT